MLWCEVVDLGPCGTGITGVCLGVDRIVEAAVGSYGVAGETDPPLQAPLGEIRLG